MKTDGNVKGYNGKVTEMGMNPPTEVAVGIEMT